VYKNFFKYNIFHDIKLFTSGVKLIFSENSGKFIFKKLEFFQKFQKNLERGINSLWRSRF